MISPDKILRCGHPGRHVSAAPLRQRLRGAAAARKTGFFRAATGFSIAEVILAVAVFGVLAAGLLGLVIVPLFSTGNVADRERGLYLAQEGIEAVKAVRNRGWHLLVDGPHGLTSSGGQWAFSGTSDTSSDGYVRVVTLSAVNRDGSGDIVTSGGTPDPRTKLLVADVTWTSPFGLPLGVSYSTYLTAFDSFSRRYDTDADFGDGSHSGSEITGTGTAAAVTISPSGVNWDAQGGINIVNTNDTDWNAGTGSGTQVTGTGPGSSVRMAGDAAWTDYTQPRTWNETTDTEFADVTPQGSFSDTVVVDTGDLGAVSLNNAIDWYTRPSPTVSPLNDVFMVSSSDGWGVGANGVIVRWDGSDWTVFADLGTHLFDGVACASASDCWAVADSGRIARWNGTTWSQFVDLGGQTFHDVHMVSSTEGYAVAENGPIFRWNGTTWSDDASGTGDDLTGVAGASTGGAAGSVAETTDTDFSDGTFSSTAVTGSGAAGSVVLTQGLNWAAMTSPTGSQLNDTEVFSASLGFAVGNGGTVIRWNGTSWSVDATFPDGDNVLGVDIISVSDAWASGANGRIWHWNGTTWTRFQDTGAQVWSDISCPTATNCFVVGNSGNNLIWRWTGGPTFSAMTDPGGNQLWRGISCVSATLCWASGNSGEIGRMSGTTWTEIQDTGSALYAIHMVDANTGFAVGDSGNVRRCVAGGCDTNGEWLTADLGAQSFRSVSAISSTSAFAVGLAGIIYHWDGVSWTADSSPTGNDLFGVFRSSASLAYAVGEAGTVLEYANHYLPSGTYISSVLDSGAAGATWGTASWTETVPGGTDVTVATRTGPTPTPDGSWSGWSGEYATPGGSAVTSPANRYVQYRATLTTGGAVTPSFDSVDITYDTSSSVLFAVSTSGAIFRRTGSGWAEIVDLGTHVFSGVACVSASDCWAVADSGRIARWNGSTWSQFVDLGGQVFTAVSLASASHGWAVGDAGEIYGWNGTTWSAAASPTGNALYGVFAVSTTYAAAVGDVGTILEYGYHYFASGTYISDAFDSEGTSNWASVFWDELLPAGTDLTIATRTGAGPDCATTGWSAWSAELTTPAGSAITSPDNRCFQYRVTVTTSDRYVTPRLNSITVAYNAPLTYDYYDLYMATPTDGWAAGCAAAPGPYTTGAVAHWDGTGWSNWAVPSHCYDGIGGSASNDVWAVDFNGDVMLHWNGSVWSTYNITSLTGSLFLNDVKCLSASDCRAVGTGGLMLRWNGSTWATESSGTSEAIEWIGYVAADDVWAAAQSGQILHYNGSAWSVFVDTGTTAWHGVYMLSATDGFIVGGDSAGNNAVMRRWNGTTWSTVTLPGTPASYELQNVHCLDANLCWASGGYQESETVILLWDGATWSNWMTYTGSWSGTQSSPLIPTNRIKAAWTDTSSHAWSVANDRVFLEYRSLYPASATWTSPAIDSGTVGATWNDIAWDAVRPPTTDVTVATRTSATGTGGWSAWSAEYTDPGGTTITSPANRYIQYRLTFTSGSLVATATVDEVRIIHSALTAEPLYSMEGAADNDVWAVGDGGVIAHLDGGGWSLVTSPVTSTLRGVDALAPNLAYAVGSSGRILAWDGATWAVMSSPTTEDLFAVDMVDANNGWAVGTNGVILVWDGVSWSNGTFGANGWRGVSMIDATDGWAVGTGGAIRHWNGTTWTSVTSPTATDLNAVHCLDTDRCTAVGDGGEIVEWDGANWSSYASPIVSRLNAVKWKTFNDAWAVGDFGAVLFWDGSSWESVTSPTTRNLYAVSYPGGGMAWICGETGTIMSLDMAGGTLGVYLGSVLDTGATSTFADAYFTYTIPVPAGVDVDFRSGPVLTPDGTWSAWGSALPLAAVVAVDAPSNRYLQYRLTLTTSDSEQPPLIDAVELTFQQ